MLLNNVEAIFVRLCIPIQKLNNSTSACGKHQTGNKQASLIRKTIIKETKIHKVQDFESKLSTRTKITRYPEDNSRSKSQNYSLTHAKFKTLN